MPILIIILRAKHGSIWYHFFDMTRSGIEHTTSRLRGERSNQWATAAYVLYLSLVGTRYISVFLFCKWSKIQEPFH